MQELSISLLREKFVIHDPKSSHGGKNTPVIALSNRIVVNLKYDDGKLVERFSIRAQNMHSCARLAARLTQTFMQAGPLLTRAKPFDWDAIWESIVNDYEFAFNPSRWAAVYHKGKVLFSKGNRHPLLDLIEKCDAGNKGAYEDSIVLAEDAFKATGKVIKIEYDGNVALVVNLEKKQGRCGIILRGADKTTTFNFSATAKNGKTLNFAQCITAAAAFLEGIQLAFMVGMNNIKLQMGIIERLTKEEKQNREAKRRLARLSAEISGLESTFEVRYRPEKPEFQQTVTESERLALRLLDPLDGPGSTSPEDSD